MEYTTIMASNELDWANLSFGYLPTDYNVRCRFADGKWGPIEESTSEYIDMHIAATALHYVAKTEKYVYSALRKMPVA